MIEKLTNFSNFSQLKVLSLGRNNIKSLSGLEAVGDTLEQLWISHNIIEKLKGINALKELKVLYISCNMVKDWGEFMKLAEVPKLEELNFVGNPLEEKMSGEGIWREEVQRRLGGIQKLDGLPLIREVSDDAFREQANDGNLEEDPSSDYAYKVKIYTGQAIGGNLLNNLVQLAALADLRDALDELQRNSSAPAFVTGNQ
ncbi:Leucine-rich repeat domain L domain-like [Trinorchestia longiramus]|nr:Leucine-rich repeat domain L domain-like [Trinorchestia longiramus]